MHTSDFDDFPRTPIKLKLPFRFAQSKNHSKIENTVRLSMGQREITKNIIRIAWANGARTQIPFRFVEIASKNDRSESITARYKKLNGNKVLIKHLLFSHQSSARRLNPTHNENENKYSQSHCAVVLDV